MVRIAMVEDNVAEAAEIKSYLDRFSKESGQAFNVTHFPDAVLFLTGYCSDCDIVLMDIEMPGLSGMEAAKKLREADSETILIFITNLAQFAINGYEVAAYDYIVKPVSYYNFALKLSRALKKHRIRAGCKEELALPHKTGVKRIAVPSVKYVEVRGHRLFFRTFDGTAEVCGSLNKAEERLKAFGFSRCNACYLVNLKYVSEIKGDTVVVGGEELQISRRKRKSFIDDLTVYLGDS